MLTLTLPKTLEQEAIAKKILDLLQQLPIGDRREIEGEVSRSISEELADKKVQCGKNKAKWEEYLEVSGFVKQDAEKRIKLTKVPKWAWGVGIFFVAQLASPMYSDMLDEFYKQGAITQEVVKTEIDGIKALRRMEREEHKAQKQAETESKFLEWNRSVYGDRTLNIVQIPEDAGNDLEQMLATFKKAADSPVDFPMFAAELVSICRESDRWFEIEALAESKKINSDNIPLSQICRGTRVGMSRKHPLAGQTGTAASGYNGSGWFVIPDSENGKENPQAVWVGTAEIEPLG